MSELKKFMRAEVITADDAVDLPGGQADAIYVGGAGSADLLLAGESAVVAFPSLAAGMVYDFNVTRVNSTNLTASNLIALYYR